MFQRKSNAARKNCLGASVENSQTFERISRVLFEHRSAREGEREGERERERERERAKESKREKPLYKIDEENGIMLTEFRPIFRFYAYYIFCLFALKRCSVFFMQFFA